MTVKSTYLLGFLDYLKCYTYKVIALKVKLKPKNWLGALGSKKS